jgi:hypothetical protein
MYVAISKVPNGSFSRNEHYYSLIHVYFSDIQLITRIIPHI